MQVCRTRRVVRLDAVVVFVTRRDIVPGEILPTGERGIVLPRQTGLENRTSAVGFLLHAVPQHDVAVLVLVVVGSDSAGGVAELNRAHRRLPGYDLLAAGRALLRDDL